MGQPPHPEPAAPGSGTPGGVAVAILAAGAGRRMRPDVEDTGPEAAEAPLAIPKALVTVAGRAMLDHALDAAIGSGLTPVLVVVGSGGAVVRDHLAARSGPEAEVLTAEGWSKGIAHSLHAALDALEDRAGVGALCVGLADQPLVGAGAYRNLAAAYDDGATFAVATYRGQRANPVLIGREFWSEARELRGDEGARSLMRHHPVVEVPCDGTGDPADVDTDEDRLVMEQRCASKTSSG